MASTALAVIKFLDVVIPMIGRSSLAGTAPFRRSVYEKGSPDFRSDEWSRSGLVLRVKPVSGFGGPKYAPSFLGT